MSSTVGLQDVQPCHQTLNSHVSLLGLLMFMSFALDSLFRDRFPFLDSECSARAPTTRIIRSI